MSNYLGNCPKMSPLKEIGFYYIPLVTFDLLYGNTNEVIYNLEPIIQESIYNNLANSIADQSNLLKVSIVPFVDNYEVEINKQLVSDISNNEYYDFITCV